MKKLFLVLDNNKLAKYPHHKVDRSWDNAEFKTFAEAIIYARRWTNISNLVLSINKPFDYSGYNDMIEIREVDDPDATII